VIIFVHDVEVKVKVTMRCGFEILTPK